MINKKKLQIFVVVQGLNSILKLLNPNKYMYEIKLI